eukprot:TRINITY_DN64714_c0_g1_i1.p1 TRINITY_DN64714_c0_g1~~TRINITY_DN64714_c0_g1_i1.p1  ORF type:complete len:477 (-),score=60.18 TRINITY_DN64714_c0_g1_i1:715-2145(-)
MGEQIVVKLEKVLAASNPPPLGMKFSKRLRNGQVILCVESIIAGRIKSWNVGYYNAKVKKGDIVLSISSESFAVRKADTYENIASVMESIRYYNAREDYVLTFERGSEENCNLERAPTTAELRKLVGDDRSGFARPEAGGGASQLDFRPTARTGDKYGDDGSPFWWGVSPAMGRNALFSIGKEGVTVMQQLFDSTWKDVTTRDREYKKTQRLVVQDVERNCNPAFWQKYVNQRTRIRQKAEAIEQCEVKTTANMVQASKLFGELDPSVNEVYLFHGTKPSAAESIAQSDFLVSLAGSHAGTLYGKGIYFAESCTKSDEYASRYPSASYCILLCRVLLGKVFYSDDPKPDRDAITAACCTERSHDSCLGDREKCRGTFREFIVYEADSIYPECIIYYKHEAPSPVDNAAPDNAAPDTATAGNTAGGEATAAAAASSGKAAQRRSSRGPAAVATAKRTSTSKGAGARTKGSIFNRQRL